jgi:hypothetical protein
MAFESDGVRLAFTTRMGYRKRSFSIAGLAQQVEHLIRNEGVIGSNPVTGTILIGWLPPQRFMRAYEA